MAVESQPQTRRYGASHPPRGEWPPEGRPRYAPEDRGSTPRRDGRSTAYLLRELSNEAAELARLEVELAKTEMIEKIDVFQRGMKSMIIGGALLLAALLTFLWAVNFALTALLAQFMSVEVAVWLSPLILAVLLGAAGWAAVEGGRHRMSEEGLAPSRTRRSLREDREFAKRKARDVKREFEEERNHG
jgi:hypothetical protein